MAQRNDEVPGWIERAAHDAAVMERHALTLIYELDATAHEDLDAARTVLRLARGLRRKLESWHRRPATT